MTMKNIIKKYLLMITISMLFLIGCDSKQQTTGKENIVESAEVKENEKNSDAETTVEKSKENELDADGLYNKGMEYYRQKEYEQALEYLEKAAELGNENAVELIANIQKSLEKQELIKEGNIAGLIKISDFMFLGLPVNENHYEEWKTKLGYMGDDTLEDSAFTNYETEYGLVSCDKKYSYIDLKNSKGFSYFLWSDLGDNFQIEISKDFEKTDLISGPILTGMTEEEIKTIIGYDESKFIEEVEDDESKIKRMDLSEGHIIVDEENPYLDCSIMISGEAGSVHIFIKDSVVTKIIIHAYK